MLLTLRRTPARCKGIALVVVLWMLALLSVIAGSLAFSTRTDLLIVGNAASMAQAEAIADGGIFRAISELLAPVQGDPNHWKGDGQHHIWQFSGANVIIRITDESARIDLNSATEDLLRGMFISLGVAETEASALVDTIQDWRDADDLRRPRGAEKDDYAVAGRTDGPANTDFETVEELRQVLGMTEMLYRAVEPLVTVHSRQPWINSAIASRSVLLALPGATPELVDIFIEQRQAAWAQGQPSPPFAVGQVITATSTSTTFSIQTEAVLGDNTRFLREAVVRLTGDPRSPFIILAWRAPAVASGAIAPPDTVQPTQQYDKDRPR